MNSVPWKLSPSDFAFLWEECKRCFYLKVVKGFQRPRGAMPKIFTAIDRQMKEHFRGKSTADFAPALPPGLVSHSDEWVKSVSIGFQGRSSACFLRGILDTVIKFDEGGYAVIDFKTSQTKEEHIRLYGRQLHAYACALEHAAPGSLALQPIRKIGLLVFEPEAFSHRPGEEATLRGGLTWIEIPRDDEAFMSFLDEVLEVLEQPDPPPAAPGCEWCRYREVSRETRF